MDRFDSEQVRKIWQRVQGNQPEVHTAPAEWNPHFELSGAITRELSCAALYRLLAKKVPQAIRNQIHRLAAEEHRHAAALQGICAVTEGRCPHMRRIPTENAPVPVLLRRCYGQKLQAIADYKKRVSDPRHGSVYQKMLEQEQNQCRILLQMIGSVEKKTL